MRGGDAVENLDAFQRVFADGGFAAEHDGVGLFVDRVGDIGDFGPGGHGGFDHAFEHVGGDDDGFADAEAGFDDAPLDDGQFLVGDFDAEIAARDHDAVGFAHDLVQVGDGLLVLDLGEDEGARAVFLEELLQLEEVARFAHEGQGDEIHAELESEFDVLDVFGGEGGQADLDARQVDMAAAAEFALGEDLALDFVSGLGEDFHFDGAVVDEHDIADVDVVDKVGVVDINGAFLFAALAADGEGEFLSGLEAEGDAEFAGSDGGALGVEHDADELASGGGGGADVFDDAADPVMGRVGHVQAENIDAGVDEPADHVGRIGGRAERGNDLVFRRDLDCMGWKIIPMGGLKGLIGPGFMGARERSESACHVGKSPP